MEVSPLSPLPKVDPGLLRDLRRMDYRHILRAVLFVTLYTASAVFVCHIAALGHVGWSLAAAPFYLSSTPGSSRCSSSIPS
jgi:hypothetical protein